MNTNLLEQELAPLNARISQIQKQREGLERELRVVETELEKFSGVRQRFEALRDVCDAFERLKALKSEALFWKGIPGSEEADKHLERAKARVVRFEEQIGGVLEQQAKLREQLNEHLDELDGLYEALREAYEREERRKEEFIIERQISPVPFRAMIMSWTREAESERRFRRAVAVALLLCLVFGSLVPLVKVPIPDRSVAVVEIPERLAMLVKKEPPKPVPPPKPESIQAVEEPKKSVDETKPRSEPEKNKKPSKTEAAPLPAPEPVKAAEGGGTPAARKKAESVGVLAFKNTFKDLMEETPVAGLGTEARLTRESPRVAGQAVAQRSLVAMQAKGGSSGGIGNAAVSRNIGNGNSSRFGSGGIGSGGSGSGGGFAQVESAIAGIAESSRPLSDGPGAGRTDEEIQIVFDRYKASLYRIYNTELRKDPTLRGKILLRISIEPNGEVSMCQVESSDLDAPTLVSQIVERIRRFNFGPKEDVPKMTILYPIDFLPAG